MAIERWQPRRGLVPWSPFEMMEEMGRRFEDVFGREFPTVWRRLPAEERAWAPAIEVMEKDDKFLVRAELPGMKKEDIDVSVTGDTLTIKGERKAESEVKEENYYRSERVYGNFFRSISLPTSVDTKKIEASYKDGILEIGLPKAPEVQPKKIEISVK